MSLPEYAIDVDDLCKNLGEIHALSGLSFEAKPSEVYGLIGPNGAWKNYSP